MTLRTAEDSRFGRVVNRYSNTRRIRGSFTFPLAPCPRSANSFRQVSKDSSSGNSAEVRSHSCNFSRIPSASSLRSVSDFTGLQGFVMAEGKQKRARQADASRSSEGKQKRTRQVDAPPSSDGGSDRVETSPERAIYNQHMMLKKKDKVISQLRQELSDKIWEHTTDNVRQCLAVLQKNTVLAPCQLKGLATATSHNPVCMLWLTGHDVPVPTHADDEDWEASFTSWLSSHPESVADAASKVPAIPSCLESLPSARDTVASLDRIPSDVIFWILLSWWDLMRSLAGLPPDPLSLRLQKRPL